MDEGILCIAIFTSCSPSKKLSNSNFNVSREDFVKAYKISFICGCLNQASDNKLSDYLKQQNDPGLFSEIDQIGYFVVKEADSIGRLYASKISRINYEDAGFGRPVFSGCIYYGLTKEIDSIAKKAFSRQFNKKK